MKTKTSKAFSLIELSIVILIIGILLVGVTQGSRLVGQMKLASARSLTQSSPVNSIKGLSLWLETSSNESFSDADEEDGATVTIWKDINPQSLAKLTATAQTGVLATPVNLTAGIPTTSAATQITYLANGINGIPSVSFNVDAASIQSKRLTLSSVPEFTVTHTFTTFVVYKKLQNTTQGALIGNGVSATEGWIYSAFQTGDNAIVSTNAGSSTTGGTVSYQKPEILTITSSAASISSYLNGKSTTSGGSYLIAITNSAPTAFYIGNSYLVNSPWKGLISEIIIFDGAMKTADRRSIEAYLGKKYGIMI